MMNQRDCVFVIVWNSSILSAPMEVIIMLFFLRYFCTMGSILTWFANSDRPSLVFRQMCVWIGRVSSYVESRFKDKCREHKNCFFCQLCVSLLWKVCRSDRSWSRSIYDFTFPLCPVVNGSNTKYLKIDILIWAKRNVSWSMSVCEMNVVTWCRKFKNFFSKVRPSREHEYHSINQDDRNNIMSQYFLFYNKHHVTIDVEAQHEWQNSLFKFIKNNHMIWIRPSSKNIWVVHWKTTFRHCISDIFFVLFINVFSLIIKLWIDMIFRFLPSFFCHMNFVWTRLFFDDVSDVVQIWKKMELDWRWFDETWHDFDIEDWRIEEKVISINSVSTLSAIFFMTLWLRVMSNCSMSRAKT